MIKARIRAAKEVSKVAITYTTHDNYLSANNLIKEKFLLYIPHNSYAGTDKLYFKKLLK